ncbi:nuclear transport factor 2 family protein [Sphingomonas sp. HITSZ_GF]|uniref:YybH family protein n=1 Tax=Sphingomonas sp. HITSZ_GF TaxID=3037247 RepID=UPI00240D4089|nr:nuclear transport factor 2 family protein [Sphingomonas sp. HITSZ_GF]MDG2532161.1 nuclear transport factor 2 family protein [Sphingomonas sp. HITSZ_GF]
MSIEQEIAAFVADYMRLWNAYDVPAMQALWDTDETAPIYVAEEAEPMLGWPAIHAYWGIDRSKSERLLTWDRLEVRQAAPDVAIAFYHMRWNALIPGNRLYPRPIGGAVRVSAMLRRKPAGWRLFHYVEAPLAALIQMRQAAEAMVDPVLHARIAAKAAAKAEG